MLLEAFVDRHLDHLLAPVSVLHLRLPPHMVGYDLKAPLQLVELQGVGTVFFPDLVSSLLRGELRIGVPACLVQRPSLQRDLVYEVRHQGDDPEEHPHLVQASHQIPFEPELLLYESEEAFDPPSLPVAPHHPQDGILGRVHAVGDVEADVLPGEPFPDEHGLVSDVPVAYDEAGALRVVDLSRVGVEDFLDVLPPCTSSRSPLWTSFRREARTCAGPCNG